jgi:hypothetical protein
MKNMRYIILCAGILMAVACSKDKPETKPSIKIKSVSSSIVPINGNLQIVLEFTDKEGDVDDSLFVNRVRLNNIGAVRGERLIDSFYLLIPEFPEKSSGEITLNLKYNFHLKDAIEAFKDAQGHEIADSVLFRFALQDRGGNTSDTVSTEQIVVQRP